MCVTCVWFFFSPVYVWVREDTRACGVCVHVCCRFSCAFLFCFVVLSTIRGSHRINSTKKTSPTSCRGRHRGFHSMLDFCELFLCCCSSSSSNHHTHTYTNLAKGAPSVLSLSGNSLNNAYNLVIGVHLCCINGPVCDPRSQKLWSRC